MPFRILYYSCIKWWEGGRYFRYCYSGIAGEWQTVREIAPLRINWNKWEKVSVRHLCVLFHVPVSRLETQHVQD